MSRRSRASNKLSFFVIGAVIVVFALLIAWYAIAISEQKELDPTTACNMAGVTNHSVILVDQTDLLDHSQLNALRSFTNEVTSDMKEGDMLSLFELSDQDPYLSGPLFSRCLPRSAKTASELSANLRMLREAFESGFMEPLSSGIGHFESVKEKSANQTAIIEALLELANRDDFGVKIQNRRLLIVSDMLQHSKILSLYNGGVNHTEKARDWNSILMRSPDLSGVEIHILLLLRPEELGGRLQNDSLILFWEEYFEKTGAAITSIKKAN